jgi:hypothetical protein
MCCINIFFHLLKMEPQIFLNINLRLVIFAYLLLILKSL